MESLREKVAADLNIEIAGEDKDWFKERVIRMVRLAQERSERAQTLADASARPSQDA